MKEISGNFISFQKNMANENKDPLHGVTLKMMLEALYEYYGWEFLALQINIRCFKYDPSIKSSLTFLRKTPWARAKVEEIYLKMLERKKN